MSMKKKEESDQSEEIITQLQGAKEYLEEFLDDKTLGMALATIYLALLDGE